MRVLPEKGTLLVSTDVHGNLADFRALEQLFYRALETDPDANWAILGDAVHGPSEAARQQNSALWDFPDQSWEIVERIIALIRRHPANVHYVLGNHDHGHVGGPRTGKFHPDEVRALEAHLEPRQVDAMGGLFHAAQLALVAPCGLLLTHASPDDTLRDLDDLNQISLRPTENSSYQNAVLSSFLTHYGQTDEVTERLLGTVSKGGHRVSVLVHGHDNDPEGWYKPNDHELGLVIFGAPRHKKAYVIADLAARYRAADDLRKGREIRRLYPD